MEERTSGSFKHLITVKFLFYSRSFPVFALRNNPFRLATLCLALLCLLLVAVAVGQSVHCESLLRLLFAYSEQCA